MSPFTRTFPPASKLEVDGAAIEAALEKGDFSGALKLIATSWPRLAALWGSDLRSVIEHIPEKEWSNDPWILAALGASFRSIGSTSRSAALPYFQRAEQLIASGASDAADLPAVQLHHAACLRSLGLLDSARLKAESAQSLLQGELELAFPLRLSLQAQAALQLGAIELHLGSTEAAVAHLQLACGLGEHNLAPSDWLECLSALAFTAYLAGDFDRAELLLEQALTAASDTGLLDSGFGAVALLTKALIAVDRNDAISARALESRLVDAARGSDWEPLACYARSATAGISGQLIEALELQRRSIAATRHWQGNPVSRLMAETLRGSLHLHLGEIDAAATLLTQLTPDRDHASCPAALLAGIRFGAADFVGCLDALQDCEKAGAGHSSRTIVDGLLLTAAANYELGSLSTSDVSFDRALYLGVKTGIRVPFFTLPRLSMLRMLGRATDRYQPETVHRLLDELRHSSNSPGELVEPLSERELEIAHHLIENKTVGQIAAELFISANTVKTHVRSVYRKLSASSRQEAVRRVHELGLTVRITPF